MVDIKVPVPNTLIAATSTVYTDPIVALCMTIVLVGTGTVVVLASKPVTLWIII